MSKLCGLNVVQLREELQKRSLVTSGNKEVLVARLREALIDEDKNPDEFKVDDAGEDNKISTGTFTNAKMMELLLSMSTEIKQQIKEQSERQTEELKQIKEQSERQSERQTEELKQQIKEQSERQTEELKQIKDQLKHVKLEVAEQIEEQSTRIEMIEQKLDRQTVEVDHKIDKLKQELEQSKIPLDHASGRTLKVPAFDGEMSWNVYKTQFEAAATSNCWNGKERATALILALRGSTAEVLQTIPAENHFNYEVLVSALDLRYGEEHMKQIYRSQLRNRTQRSGESIQQLAQDIERLTLLSYPTSDPEHRDETVLDTMTLRTVSLLNRQSKHQKVTYVYAKYTKNALARRGGKPIGANFVGQRLASRIDAPSTVINVSRLHRNRNDLWLNGKVDQRECVITVETGATKSILSLNGFTVNIKVRESRLE
ncbi:hypothetical protein HELRODRAFT_159619 [Helobdella robusta]|uniref:SAP domain-containing protein n=1 Tax=Helobdella robusta TaxID=6412 RepID=T1EP90_HELRO|nr:hypothetical protein HELRODRAFT_159619 [Helobdella robusta]ESO13022.1 hypothetical protein HELRODRAFT_159619 [Helobdella robusta]